MVVEIQPWGPLTAVEQSGEDAESLLTREVKATENTNKDKTARYKKRLEHWL